MNLAEAKVILSNINWNVLETPGYLGTEYYHYKGVDDLRTVISQLGSIKALLPTVEALTKSQLFTDNPTKDGKLLITKDSGENVNRLIDRLYYSALAINSFVGDSITVEKEDSVRIKLPSVKDFDDIAKVMNDLKRAISIPLAEEDAGYVSIEHGESGSVWLFVYLGARKAVKLVAEIAWAAMVVMNKKNELDYVAEQVKTYKMGEEYITNIVDAQKKLLDQLVSGEAMGIHNRVNEDGKPLDNEAHQKLILSINTMADLYERGFKVLPSLSVKEDVKNLFPSSTVEKLIESRNKQLPEGGNSEAKE